MGGLGQSIRVLAVAEVVPPTFALLALMLAGVVLVSLLLLRFRQSLLLGYFVLWGGDREQRNSRSFRRASRQRIISVTWRNWGGALDVHPSGSSSHLASFAICGGSRCGAGCCKWFSPHCR